jgi:4-aminobutyrate aminotransferase-like enzyme
MTESHTLGLLRRFESRNVTFIDPDGSWPIVWQRAKGVHVWDEQGKKYLDLTAAFGVAAAGHGNPQVVRAGQKQMAQLLHAMGDVHPHPRKGELARELSRLTFERWDAGTAKTIFSNSGFEAVEAALKTVHLFTNRPRIIAFEGAYHGLGYGALSATHRAHFRNPFRRQLQEFADFVSFPEAAGTFASLEKAVRQLARANRHGAILVEPVQARGGVRVPPRGFLRKLRELCDELQLLLVLDEIYTGFGRTGRWFACEHEGVVPDLICLGKALTGGFPLSACVGRADLMDRAWPPSGGEAIHTSTFLGHPVGCAMALAQIREIESRCLAEAAAQKGRALREALDRLKSTKLLLRPAGLGLLAGVSLHDSAGRPATSEALGIIKNLLRAGFIFLPEGEHSNVLSFTPALTIPTAQLLAATRAVQKELDRL